MELIEKQQAELNEEHALYIKNMVDKAGQPFNAYAKFDKEENRHFTDGIRVGKRSRVKPGW